jgi:phosphoenolpyruvate carboxykinase (ATP)
VVDGFAGFDPKWRIKVRVIVELPYHALFMKNMLVRPMTTSRSEYDELIQPKSCELEEFDQGVDWHIFNAGMFRSDPKNIEGVKKPVSVNVNFTEQELCVLGSLYAGEMKKGVFGVMNTLMPWKG